MTTFYCLLTSEKKKSISEGYQLPTICTKDDCLFEIIKSCSNNNLVFRVGHSTYDLQVSHSTICMANLQDWVRI
jgi:hypothetical protein